MIKSGLLMSTVFFLEELTASLLQPGIVIENIYRQVMEQFDPQYENGFMNGGKFLGHSIGLVMDESPALANGFKGKLEAGMVFAVEPKIALPGIGMVGTEKYVSGNGRRCEITDRETSAATLYFISIAIGRKKRKKSE